MSNIRSGFVIMLLFAVAIKSAAMLEWAPLYHTLLFAPAQLAALLSDEVYTALKGTYRFKTFVLDHSCAGVNFLLLCLIAGAWHFRQRAQTTTTFVLVTAGAWLTANVANAFRIGLSLKLFHYHTQHAWLHEAIGTTVFMVFLLGYYQLILRVKYAKADSAS